MTRRAGFTLIEALVALAIFAATAIPIYSLLATTADSAFRAATANRRASLRLSALDAIRAINPMTQPQGELEGGAFKIRWSAQVRSGPEDQVRYPRGIGLYRVALYDVDVEILDIANGNAGTRFRVAQVGFQRVRDPVLPFSNTP